MERGPVALFAAIVAVGLGPALWLGAQFGNATVVPERPPAVFEANQDKKAPGGAGAAPEEPAVTETGSKSRYVPLSSTPSARPSATATSRPAESGGEPSTEPSATRSTPAGAPSTPQTETTTDPADDPPVVDSDPDLPGDSAPPAPEELEDSADGPTV